MLKTSSRVCYNNGIIKTSDSIYQFDSKGAGYMIFTHLQKHADKPLQIDAETGEQQTYREVLEKSIRIALNLQIRGIKPKDTVLICTTNHINSCIPVFASLFIGSSITGFDTKMHLNEASILMDQIDPKIIFVDSGSLHFIESLLRTLGRSALIVVFGPTFNHVNFFDLLSPNPDEAYFTPVPVEQTDIAYIAFTTGSTGIPKGACINHRAFLARIAAYTEYSDFSQRSLLCATWYWTVNFSYWGSIIFQGGCRILQECFDSSSWKAISKYKLTQMLMTPFEMRQLCESKPSEAEADSLQKILICGSSLSDQELIRYRTMFRNCVVVRGYGLSEAGLLLDFPCSSKKDLKFVDQKLKSIGRILPGINYKVVDVDSGRAVRPHQKGELRVQTKCALSGYYKQDSNALFDNDGWLKTGDIVHYDEDYYFYYEDRLKEMIKYRNWHVPPRIIENALLSRDDITDACVFGIPHDHDDEHPVAVIKLRHSSAHDDIDEDICQYTKDLFGDKWKLRKVQIVEEIPLTPTGKYDIRKIKNEMFCV